MRGKRKNLSNNFNIKDVPIVTKIKSTSSDNEILLYYQYMYYTTGDDKYLSLFFLKARVVALKFINKTITDKGVYVCAYNRREMAIDTAVIIIERYLQNKLVIKSSVTGYIYLTAKRPLFYATKAEKLERWCRKNKINILKLDSRQREIMRKKFDKDMENEKETSVVNA